MECDGSSPGPRRLPASASTLPLRTVVLISWGRVSSCDTSEVVAEQIDAVL